MDDGEPISYLALRPGAVVRSASGTLIGTVEEVLQIPSEDLFDGIVVSTDQGSRFIDSSQISSITTTTVHSTVTDAEAADLPLPLGASPSSKGAPAATSSSTDTSWTARIGRFFGRGT